MIPNGQSTTLESSMAPEQTIGMTIDEGAMAHIMSVLTDLYSDPVAAVIREYSTNGYDSHIEAGVKRPIEVTLPTVYAQNFMVRDFGLGLDVDDLYRIYSRYGASTKRESNDVVGMLGLGCKSGLTFTNQFSIVSHKNGVQVTALVYLQDNGVGAIDIVDTKATDEPNGVLISIPVDNSFRDFADKAAEFFRFWPKGTVLVNGSEPASFIDEDGWTEITPGTFVRRSSYWDASIHVVMGNVCYKYDGESPFGDSKKTNLRQAKIVHFAPIGSVQFAPSRESLMDSALTKSYIQGFAKGCENALIATFQAKLNTATTAVEAMKIAANSRGLVTMDPVWRGKKMPGQISSLSAIQYEVGRSRYAVSNNANVYTPLAGHIQQAFYVKGYPLPELKNPTHKQGITAWANSLGMSTNYGNSVFLIGPDKTPSEWLEWHDWSEIEPFVAQVIADKKANAGTSAYGTVRTVRGVTEYTAKGSISAPSLDTNDKYVVYSQNQTEVSHNAQMVLIDNGYRVIEMTKNRHAKFMREFPNTVEVRTALTQIEKDAWDDLTDADKARISAHASACYMTKPVLEAAKGRTLLDPHLASVVKSFHEPETPEVKRWYRVANCLPQTRDKRTIGLKALKVDVDKYPILRAVYYISNKKALAQTLDFIDYLATQEGN